MDGSHPSRLNLRVGEQTELCSIAAPAPLVIRTCAHVLDSGVLCQAPARHGQRYCRHHVELRARRWRMAKVRRRMRVRIPALLDMEAVHLARARVRYAIAAGRMSPSDAKLFFFALRIAASNLCFLEAEDRWDEDLEMSGAGVPGGP